MHDKITGLFARSFTNSQTGLPFEPNWFVSRAELVCLWSQTGSRTGSPLEPNWFANWFASRAELVREPGSGFLDTAY